MCVRDRRCHKPRVLRPTYPSCRQRSGCLFHLVHPLNPRSLCLCVCALIPISLFGRLCLLPPAISCSGGVKTRSALSEKSNGHTSSHPCHGLGGEKAGECAGRVNQLKEECVLCNRVVAIKSTAAATPESFILLESKCDSIIFNGPTAGSVSLLPRPDSLPGCREGQAQQSRCLTRQSIACHCQPG